MAEVIDTRTPALGLPLPHPDNDLEDDVLRMREALGMLEQLLLGKLGAGDLTPASVGLDRVDNTPDAEKPVSGPQAIALAAKASAEAVLALDQQVANLATAVAAAAKKATVLPQATNLNAVLESGFYCVGAAAGNAPAGLAAEGCQLIVSGAGASAAQILVDKATGALFVRAASGLPGAPAWSAWRRVALHNEGAVAATGGVMDCSKGNEFTLTVAANTALSFANVPEGVYSCTLEVLLTAGALTMPAGGVWTGAAPAIAAGRRHLFFFRRAQLGTPGWYMSALDGYPA